MNPYTLMSLFAIAMEDHCNGGLLLSFDVNIVLIFSPLLEARVNIIMSEYEYMFDY